MNSPPPLEAEGVAQVSGTKCHLCLEPLTSKSGATSCLDLLVATVPSLSVSDLYPTR
jgi:hypothetical protein